jgi:coenzyme F420 hydrogenase subunit beta
MSGADTVSEVARQRLCTACGACCGVCPRDAVRFEETTGGYLLPIVDEQRCDRCGLCLAVCPGVHFGKTLQAKLVMDPFAGTVQDAFVGKATNRMLYENSQSGGIVSGLLSHGLETGIIKGAITVVMQAGIPPRPRGCIVRNNLEISESQKSKYCPVPMLGLLRQIEEEDGPLAVVGTSCQIHGLFNFLDKRPNLRGKINLIVGLVCDRVLSFAALDYLIRESGLQEERNPAMFHFRDKTLPNGYPGDVHVYTDKGKSVILPAKSRMRIKDFFTPARCRICFDKMNVFADITVGDPHGLSGVDQRGGESMLLVRTVAGRDAVRAAQIDGAIDIRKADYLQILRGQNVGRKKEHWRGYSEAWKITGRDCPDFFQLVENFVSRPEHIANYLADIEYAIDLDRFKTRDDLILFVSKRLQRKQIIDLFTFPVRMAKRIIQKIVKSWGF